MPSVRSALFLNDHCFVQGGASRIAIDEAVALADRGVDVTFLGATGPIGPELAASRVRTICLGQPELVTVASNRAVAWQGLWNATAARRTRGILSGLDRSQTIAHLHAYTKSLTTSPLRAAVHAGFPILATLHDFFSICPTGNLYDYVKQVPCELRPLSLQCIVTNCDKRRYAHKLYRVARGALQRWPGLLPSGVEHFIGLSARSVGLIRPYLPATAHVYRLGNIIDLKARPPVEIRRGGTLVFVGRLDPEKGVLLLLEAADRIGASLVFIGDGPLRAAVESSGRHRVTGWLTSSQVQAELDEARCLVFPSQWYETFGLVVDEAAARGIPAIVSDVSAAAERVRDGVTGFVFRSGDCAALAQCLDAAGDIERLAHMGRNAYDSFWSAPPDRENHAKRLLEIYETVLDASTQRAKAVHD
jgi:glycosyltransferase involved in cell wall biosynthesis